MFTLEALWRLTIAFEGHLICHKFFRTVENQLYNFETFYFWVRCARASLVYLVYITSIKRVWCIGKRRGDGYMNCVTILSYFWAPLLHITVYCKGVIVVQRHTWKNRTCYFNVEFISIDLVIPPKKNPQASREVYKTVWRHHWGPQIKTGL